MPRAILVPGLITPNRPPIWSAVPNQGLTELVFYSVDLDAFATDPEFQPLFFSIVSGSLPAGVSLSGATGVISGIPVSGSAGTHNVTFHASDGKVVTSQRVTFVVAPAAGQGSIVRDKDPDPSIIITAGQTTFDIARAHHTAGAPLTAKLLWASSGGSRTIQGVTLSVINFSGTNWRVDFVAGSNAVTGTYDDIEIKWDEA